MKINRFERPLYRAAKVSTVRRLAVVVFAISGFLSHVADAALISVSNVNSSTNGGFALKTSTDTFLADPPALIHFGGFSTFTTSAAIQTAFLSNFAALAADFVSIGSVAVESDSLGGVQGIVDASVAALDPTAVVGRDFAVWITTSGTVNDTGAEHLIYLTSQTFTADPIAPAPEGSYDARLRSGADGGNGTLAVGGFGNFTNDYGFGAGSEAVFNTVAIPEPSSILFLSSLLLAGFFAYRRRRKTASGSSSA